MTRNSLQGVRNHVYRPLYHRCKRSKRNNARWLAIIYTKARVIILDRPNTCLHSKRHGSLGGSREAIPIILTSLATVDRNGPALTFHHDSDLTQHRLFWLGCGPVKINHEEFPTLQHVIVAPARWELYYQPFEAAIDVGAGAVPFRNSGGKLGMLHKVEKTTKDKKRRIKSATNMGQHGTTIFQGGTKCRFTNHLLSWNGICMTQDWLVFAFHCNWASSLCRYPVH